VLVSYCRIDRLPLKQLGAIYPALAAMLFQINKVVAAMVAHPESSVHSMSHAVLGKKCERNVNAWSPRLTLAKTRIEHVINRI